MLDTAAGAAVPRVLELGTTGATPWLAMSVAGERSLAHRLREEGACDLADARTIVLGIATELQRVHDAGVLHMDLTPSNVMLAGNRVSLIDFGAAHRVTGSPLAGSSSYDGTAGYVAPERCLGAPPHASMDVFSLGAVAYRALMGARPYVDPRTLAIARTVSPKRLQDPCLLRMDIGTATSDLLLRALSLDPCDRPQSAGAFADEFASALPA